MDTKDQNKLLLPEKKKKLEVVNWTREQPYKVLGEYAKEKKKQITDKVTKIVEGIKATPSFIKKNLKKKDKD
jgi:hypothetical protein